MPNYDTTSAPGQTRRRISQVQLNNPLIGVKTAQFTEQEVIRTTDGTEIALAAQYQPISFGANDLTVSIPKIDPITNTANGMLTLQEVYIAINSLGRYAQLQRDANDATRKAERDAASQALAAQALAAQALAAAAPKTPVTPAPVTPAPVTPAPTTP